MPATAAATAKPARKAAPQKGPRTKTIKKKDGTQVTVAHGGVRRPHRFRPGTVALRDIRKYQKSTELLAAKKPFQRLVRHIAQGLKSDVRFEPSALAILQEVSEAEITGILKAANDMCCDFGKKTLMVTGVKHTLINQGRGYLWYRDPEEELAPAPAHEAPLPDDEDDDEEFAAGEEEEEA